MFCVRCNRIALSHMISECNHTFCNYCVHDGVAECPVCLRLLDRSKFRVAFDDTNDASTSARGNGQQKKEWSRFVEHHRRVTQNPQATQWSQIQTSSESMNRELSSLLSTVQNSETKHKLEELPRRVVSRLQFAERADEATLLCQKMNTNRDDLESLTKSLQETTTAMAAAKRKLINDGGCVRRSYVVETSSSDPNRATNVAATIATRDTSLQAYEKLLSQQAELAKQYATILRSRADLKAKLERVVLATRQGLPKDSLTPPAPTTCSLQQFLQSVHRVVECTNMLHEAVRSCAELSGNALFAAQRDCERAQQQMQRQNFENLLTEEITPENANKFIVDGESQISELEQAKLARDVVRDAADKLGPLKRQLVGLKTEISELSSALSLHKTLKRDRLVLQTEEEIEGLSQKQILLETEIGKLEGAINLHRGVASAWFPEVLISNQQPFHLSREHGEVLIDHNKKLENFTVRVLRSENGCQLLSAMDRTNTRWLIKQTSKPDEFEREVKILWQLDHVNVIKPVSIFYGNTLMFMQFSNSTHTTLEDLIEKFASAPIDVDNNLSESGDCRSVLVVHRLFRAILHAIEYIHQKGIAHRNICPLNVLLEEVPILYDFRFSCKTSERIVPAASPTSIAFVAPDFATVENKLLPSVDIFSFGAMLARILLPHIHFPTNGRGLVQLLDGSHIGQQSSDPTEILRKSLLDQAKRCLHPQAQERPTAQELLSSSVFRQDLAQYLPAFVLPSTTHTVEDGPETSASVIERYSVFALFVAETRAQPNRRFPTIPVGVQMDSSDAMVHNIGLAFMNPDNFACYQLLWRYTEFLDLQHARADPLTTAGLMQTVCLKIREKHGCGVLEQNVGCWLPSKFADEKVLEGIGRLFAKCILEGMAIPLQLSCVALAVMLAVDEKIPALFSNSDSALKALREFDPAIAASLLVMQLESNLEDVQDHCKELLFLCRRSQLLALRRGFMYIRDLWDRLRLFSPLEIQSLFFENPLDRDVVLSNMKQLQRSEQEDIHFQWVKDFIALATELELRVFVMKITGKLPGQLLWQISLTISPDGEQENMALDCLLVVPRCGTKDELISSIKRFVHSIASDKNTAVCILCGDLSSTSNGVSCCAATPHFVCNTCFDQYVAMQSEEQSIDVLMRRQGRIFCPAAAPRCSAAEIPFVDKVVAEHVSVETFAKYQAVATKINEHKVAKAAEKQIKEHIERLQKMDEAQRRTELMRHHVINNVLTMKCPSCNLAFIDFTGCAAVTCSCGTAFCGFCQENCGADAHPHTARCRFSPQVGELFFSDAQLVAGQRLATKDRLVRYLDELTEDDRAKLLASIQKELKDLQIQL